MTVPCGKCIPCLMNRASVWTTRLMNEKNYYDDSVFVTLTYDEKHMPENMSINKRDPQLFFKRLRKKLGGREIKYYLGAEYGGRYKRPHYHAIIYNVNSKESADITSAWGRGFVHVGSVTDDSCNYVAKYIIGKEENVKPVGAVKEFSLMSKGMGKRWVEKYKNEIFNRGFIVQNGYKKALPRYYRERVYDDQDKRDTLEERRIKFHLENNKKELDNIEKMGYTENDLYTKRVRESVRNNMAALYKLKVREI